MRDALVLAVLIGLAGPAGAQSTAPTERPTVATFDAPDLIDAARGRRRVPIKVHHPTTGGPYPLVIYSHGGGGNRDAHLYEAQFMAAQGYVVLCIEHVFSNNEALKRHIRAARGTLKQRMHVALMKITRDPRAVLERPRDVTFAIDRAVAWNRAHPALKGLIDTRKIAVAGHSFGAGTVLAACGARLSTDHLDGMPAGGLAPDYADARITVGIAMSPQGPGTSRFSRASFATVRRPLLCFTGTLDHQFGHDGRTQPATARLEGFRLLPVGEAGVKYMAWLQNADHLAFASNPKSHLLPSRARADTHRIVKALTLAFCDAYLKGRADARAKLTQAYASTLTGSVVTKVDWTERR